MLAAILGATLALWLLQGDTSASDTFTAKVQIEDSYSFSPGFTTILLRFPDGSAVTVMGSDVIPIVSALKRSEGQTVDLDLRPRVVQRLER